MATKVAGVGSRWKNRQNSSAVGQAAQGVIERLEPRQLLSSVVTTFPVPVADSSYWSGYDSHIVAGPHGNFWFTDSTNNSIDEVTPGGKVTEFALPVHNVDDGYGDIGPDYPDPTNIIMGSDGNLWFTESGVDRIGRITPNGVITEFTTPNPQSNPTGIALGADGNIWFGEPGSNTIGRITPSGAVKEFSLLNYDVAWGDSLTAGPDGNVWFIANDESYNGAIGSISPTGKLSFHPLDSNASAIATGSDGNLWVAAGDAIERITPAGASTTFALPDNQYSYISSLSAGTDGNLYFVLSGNSSFGRITTDGTITEYSLPNGGADPSTAIQIADLAQAPDGRFWFVDSYTPQVGVIDLTNALLATGASINVTAGSPQTSTIGSFIDLSGSSTAADYTATVTLSDDTTIDASIAANSAGGFDVTATNDWTIGFSNVTLTITDVRNTTRVATATSYVQATAPQAVGTGVDVTATAGQVFSGTVATFTNVDLNSLSSYSASIDWGDGHVTAGTVTANASGGFDITGTNDYAQSGTFSVTTTLLPYNYGIYYPGGPIGVVPLVQPSVGIGIGVDPIPGKVGVTGGVTGTVTSGNTGSSAGTSFIGFASPNGALVNNGNSSTAPTSGAITIGAPIAIGGGGINGGNAIRALPPIWFGGYESATATSTATVAAGVMQGTGYSVQASSKSPFSGDVASFTLTDPNADLSHFHATIEWNDPGVQNWWFKLSNPSSAGVITSDGNGGFTVSTSTSFTNSGLFHFVVKITDDRLGTGDAAQVGAAYGQVIVDTPNVWLPIFYANAGAVTVAGANFAQAGGTGSTGSSAPTTPDPANPALAEHVKVTPAVIKSTSNKTFSGNVGIIRGVVSGASNAADLHGTINWGDGTTSTATFVMQPKGKIAVQGSHVYTTGGTQPVTVDISQTLYNKGTASDLYPLHLPKIQSAARIALAPHQKPITTGGIEITATAGTGTPFIGDVATFTAPAVDSRVTRTATIWWGDGKHSSATVTANGNVLTISGSHVYAKARKYHVQVQVIQTVPRGSHLKVARLLAVIKTDAVVS